MPTQASNKAMQNTQIHKLYDLHSHSTCSDGTFSPSDLIAKAAAANIDVLALTDHDTLAGIPEAKAAASAHGIELIQGVEISCQHELLGGYGRHKAKNQIIHVVGLDFSDNTSMSERLTQLQESRANRGWYIVEKLAKLLNEEVDGLWQAVLAKADNNPQAVGRAHIGQVVHEKGHVKTVQQAFDKYLADNKPAYVALDALSMKEGIDLIHQCGGKAVLAHPTRYHLSSTRVRKLISEFAAHGGDGCELPAHSEPVSKRQMIDRAILEHDLAVSVGSDFHGTTMPWRKLGDVPRLKEGQQGIWAQFQHNV